MDLVQKLISRFPVISGVTLIVVVAMVVALILRLAGADFCLPMEHCHPDEHWLVTPTIKMMRTADFNPHYFVYPTLYMYVLLLVFCLTFVVGTSAGLWGGIGGIKTAPFLLAGRLTTGLLGTATVWGVYSRRSRAPSARYRVARHKPLKGRPSPALPTPRLWCFRDLVV